MEKLTNDQIAEIKAAAKKNFDKTQPQQMEYCFHLLSGSGDERVITGFDSKKDISNNDILIITSRAYKVSSIEYRDHAGFFNDPSLKFGTFFKAKMSLHANLF